VFHDFSSAPGLQLNGNASAPVTNASGAYVLQLTPSVTGQVGSAWYCGTNCSSATTPTGIVDVTTGFSTAFKFQFGGTTTSTPADGIAFVIQNGCFVNNSTSTSTCGIFAIDPTTGGSIGYGPPSDDSSTPGLTKSLAIEFDTYYNSEFDDIQSDNNISTANEVSIQTCGIGANTEDHSVSACNYGALNLGALFPIAGSAAVSQGSTTVTLTGTSYTSTQMQNMVGLSFVIDGVDLGLITAADSTAQTLTLATGAPYTLPSSSTYSVEPIIADGNQHTVQIMYTPPPASPNLTVTLDNNVVLSTTIDIVGTVLGGTDGAYVGFTGATGGADENQDILCWGFVTGTTSTQTGCAMNPSSPANLNQVFSFTPPSTPTVQFGFDYTPSFNANTLSVVTNTVPTVTPTGVNQATYQELVMGTSLAMTNCFTASGLGTDNGASLCAELTLTCTNAANSNVGSGDQCPQSTERNLFWSQIVEDASSSSGLTIPPYNGSNTAPTVAEGSDAWSPGSCAFVGPETGDLCPQSLLTQFALLSLDSASKAGGTGETSNSSFIPGCCEVEWTTTTNVPPWSNTTSVPVTFTSTPPTLPTETLSSAVNGWVAAPNKSITWGWENAGQTPDTTFPVPGDQTFTNATACPSTWPPFGTVPPNASTPQETLTVPGEGAYEVHFFSTACDDQEELVFPTSITTASPKNVASFKTQPFNVDMTSPTVTVNSLSPTPGPYTFGSTVTASITCTDPVSNGVASGIATCGTQTYSGPTGPASVTTNVTLPTTSVGPQSYPVSATDQAGNASGSQNIDYTVNGGSLIISASSPAAVNYGTATPAITASYSGLINGDPLTTLPTCTGPANGSPAATYATNCSGAAGGGYTISYVPGSVTIKPVPLTITASSATVNYGAPIPAITPSYSAFANGDTPASLTKQPTCTTTAVSTTPGSYPSTCSGAVDTNYTIGYMSGKVTVGSFGVSPTAVNFGTLYLYQPSAQLVTLTNFGTAPITISSIKVTTQPGNNAAGDYGDLTLCPPMILSTPATLPAGKSCRIAVGILPTLNIFSPTASTATLTVVAGGTSYQVPLTALVIDPQASLSASSLSFGSLKVSSGGTSTKTVTLTNTGYTPLTSIAISSSGSSYFTLSPSPTCPSALNPSPAVDSCTISVTFAPKAKGSFTGKVTITDNAFNRPQVITLSGTGN